MREGLHALVRAGGGAQRLPVILDEVIHYLMLFGAIDQLHFVLKIKRTLVSEGRV